MPFNFNAPSFFGKLGPQSAGFNPNNAVAGFQRANAISGAVPNLFTTIQMTQKNQQDRRVKEAAIAQALAGLVKTQQEVQQSPYELAIKQAQAQNETSKLANLPVENDLRKARTLLAESQAALNNKIVNGSNQVNIDENGDLVVETYKTDKYGNLVPSRVTSKSAEDAKSTRKIKEADIKAAQKEQNLFASASGLISKLKENYDTSKNPNASVPAQTGMVDAALKKIGTGIKRKASAASGTDVPLNTYLKGKNGFVSQLRQLTGDAGVLTNQDIARIQGLLPSEFSTAEEATALWNQIDQIINDGFRRAQARKEGSPMGLKDISAMSIEEMEEEVKRLSGE